MSKIKFPCVVATRGLSEESLDELNDKFLELGANYKECFTDAWKYCGVDEHLRTLREDFICEYGNESEVSIYTYKEVMAATGVEGRDSSPSDNDTATLVENEYSGSSSGESGCNQSVGASNEFSIQKEYYVYHKGMLILKGDADYLLKIKEIIEGELGE